MKYANENVEELFSIIASSFWPTVWGCLFSKKHKQLKIIELRCLCIQKNCLRNMCAH